MRYFFSRDLLLKVIEGYLIIANRDEEELALLSLADVFAFVNRLKSAFQTRPFAVSLCPECHLSDTKFTFRAKEVSLSSSDVFSFVLAIGENLNFMLMSDVPSVANLVQLKIFSCFLSEESVEPEAAKTCLQDLTFGRVSPLLSTYVSQKSTDTEKNQELLKFFLYHHKMIKCYYELNELLKK